MIKSTVQAHSYILMPINAIQPVAYAHFKAICRKALWPQWKYAIPHKHHTSCPPVRANKPAAIATASFCRDFSTWIQYLSDTIHNAAPVSGQYNNHKSKLF